MKTKEIETVTTIIPPDGVKLSKYEIVNKSDSLVRMKKDVLKCGKWIVNGKDGPKLWDVKPTTLADIVRNSQLVKDECNETFNLIWGHGDESGKVDARDIITPIESTYVEDETLWITFSVTPEIAEKLSNPGMKVSVKVEGPYLSGTGKMYPIMLTHVGIVDNPVMGSQGPFVTLSRWVATMAKKIGMGKVFTTMDFQKILDAFNELLGEWDLTLPEGTTEENLNDMLEVIMSVWRSNYKEDESETEEETTSEEDGVSVTDESELSKTVAEMSKQIKMLNSVVTTMSKVTGSNSQLRFETHLQALAKSGKVSANHVASLRTAGKATNWDTSILKAFGDVDTILMGQQSGSFVSTHAPNVGNKRPNLTEEQVKEMAKKLGGM